VSFVLYEDDFKPLLGFRALKQIQLLAVNEENIDEISAADIGKKHDDVLDASAIGTL